MSFFYDARGLFLSVSAAFILLTSGLFFPPLLSAFLALPDIGINYNSMKVEQSDRLVHAGMKNTRNGDVISLQTSGDGKLILKNIRTGETLVYP